MTPRDVFLSVRNFDGIELQKEKLDTSSKKGGLNLNSWKIGDSCLMKFNPHLNTLGLVIHVISKTMSESEYGLDNF